MLMIQTSRNKIIIEMKIIRKLSGNIYCFVYLLLIVLGINELNYFGWWIFEATLIAILYLRARKIYGSFRLTTFALSK
jgi:hypothetical protein